MSRASMEKSWDDRLHLHGDRLHLPLRRHHPDRQSSDGTLYWAGNLWARAIWDPWAQNPLAGPANYI